MLLLSVDIWYISCSIWFWSLCYSSCLLNQMNMKEMLQGAREIICKYKRVVSFLYHYFGDYGWHGVFSIQLKSILCYQYQWNRYMMQLLSTYSSYLCYQCLWRSGNRAAMTSLDPATVENTTPWIPIPQSPSAPRHRPPVGPLTTMLPSQVVRYICYHSSHFLCSFKPY